MSEEDIKDIEKGIRDISLDEKNIIKLDCKNLREERQKINNLLVLNSIINNNMNDFKKNINKEELSRILKDLDMNQDELIKYCRNNIITAKILSGRISKNSSRQGSKDEALQLKVCNITSSKYGIYIENLSATAYRPIKNGKILSHKEIKKNNINRNECLKSLDGKITGKIKGWIFSKIVYGNGGHQDNVFEETLIFCEWVKKYGIINEFYFILIDTDLKNKIIDIKNKYLDIKNLFIFNHIEYQKYITNNYQLIIND